MKDLLQIHINCGFYFSIFRGSVCTNLSLPCLFPLGCHFPPSPSQPPASQLTIDFKSEK